MKLQKNIAGWEKALRTLAKIESAALTSIFSCDDTKALAYASRLFRSYRARLSRERPEYDARDYPKIAALLGGAAGAVTYMRRSFGKAEFKAGKELLEKSAADIWGEICAVREKLDGSEAAEKLCEYFDKLSGLYSARSGIGNVLVRVAEAPGEG